MCVGREADHITLYVCVSVLAGKQITSRCMCVTMCVFVCLCEQGSRLHNTVCVCVSVCVWAGKQTEGESVPSGSLH